VRSTGIRSPSRSCPRCSLAERCPSTPLYCSRPTPGKTRLVRIGAASHEVVRMPEVDSLPQGGVRLPPGRFTAIATPRSVSSQRTNETSNSVAPQGARRLIRLRPDRPELRSLSFGAEKSRDLLCRSNLDGILAMPEGHQSARVRRFSPVEWLASRPGTRLRPLRRAQARSRNRWSTRDGKGIRGSARSHCNAPTTGGRLRLQPRVRRAKRTFVRRVKQSGRHRT